MSETLIGQVGLVVCDSSGAIIYANDKARALVFSPDLESVPLAGRAQALRLYRPDHTLFPTNELPISRSALIGVSAHDMQVLIRVGEDRFKTVMCCAAPIRDQTGTIRGAIGVLREATPDGDMAGSTSLGLLVVDGSGRWVVASRAVGVVLGSQPSLGSAGGSAVPAISIEGPDGSLVEPNQWPWQRILRGERVLAEDYVVHAADGITRRIRLGGHPVSSPRGQILAGIVVFRDRTMEWELQNARDSLHAAFAHEFRNPLAGASGLVDLVSARVGTASREWLAARLKLAQAELDRLRRLTDQVVSAHALSMGRLPLDLRTLDLAQVIREALEPFLSCRPIRVTMLRPPATRVPVMGDCERLRSVVFDLVDASLRCSADRATKVAVVQRARVVLVRVKTRGELPADLGVSLLIARDMVRRHGGDLWSVGRPGGGTLLSLRLPLAAPSSSGS